MDSVIDRIRRLYSAGAQCLGVGDNSAVDGGAFNSEVNGNDLSSCAESIGVRYRKIVFRVVCASLLIFLCSTLPLATLHANSNKVKLTRVRAKLKVFAYYEPSQPNGIADFIAHASQISVVAPDWCGIGLTSERVSCSPNSYLMALAKLDNIAVWPVVGASASYQPWLVNESVASLAADNVSSLAGPYEGITIDIEQILPSEQANFTTFIAELAQDLHAEGKGLAVYLDCVRSSF